MKLTRPALGGEVAPPRVVPPPAVLPATAPSAVVRLNVPAGASALRVGNQLVVSARVALAVPALASVQDAEALASAPAVANAQVVLSTAALVSVRVGLAAPALASAQDAEALASVLVDQSTAAPVTALVVLDA